MSRHTQGAVASSRRRTMIPVDLFLGYESGNSGDAISVAALDAAMQRRFAIGANTVTANALALMQISSTTQRRLQGQYSLGLGGVAISDSAHTRGMRTRIDTNTNYHQFAFVNGVGFNRATLGCWLLMPTTTGANIDLIQLIKLTGGYVVVSATDNNTALRIHTDDTGNGSSPPGFGPKITGLTPGNWYFCAWRAVRSGTCELRVYDANMAFVGTSSHTSGQNSPFQIIRVGRTDGTPEGHSANYVGVDALIIDWTYAVPPADLVSYNPANYTNPASVLNVSDDFAGTGALSGNWTEQQAGIARNGGLGEVASAQTFATAGMAFWSANSFHKNQYARATIKAWGNGQNPGVMVRANGTGANRNAYAFYPRTAQTRSIVKIINGVATNLGAPIADPGWALNDVLEMVAYGEMIAVLRNGAVVGCVFDDDAALLSGSPGLIGWRESWGSAVQWDDFQGGNVTN